MCSELPQVILLCCEWSRMLARGSLLPVLTEAGDNDILLSVSHSRSQTSELKGGTIF